MSELDRAPWIDVSVPLYTGMVHWPGDPEFHSDLAKSMARGEVCNVSAISTSVHIGTHMDAPGHFVPDGAGIEQMPLDAVLGRCRVIEIRDRESIKPAGLEAHQVSPGERILFKTINSAAWNTDGFKQDFVYVSKEAAQWLVDHQVRTIGVDYLSVGGFFKDGVETHQILLGAGVWIIEGLNLSQIQPGAYELICLPVKIRGGDGAPARAILRPL